MTATPADPAVLSLALRHEHDVVAARQRGRQVAGLLGFEAQDQTRIATAVSEIARNAFTYAGGGVVTFLVEGRTAPQVFAIRIADQGPGIPELERILAGAYRSSTGTGLGIAGTRRLMDQFSVESAPGRGTTVWLRKILPREAPLLTATGRTALADVLARERPRGPLEEVQQQNQELLRALDELRGRQEDMSRLNGELEDTNRGVVALLAELDEKADHLRRADEMKTRFLSNMSHEFRTPLNSVLALSRLLLDRTDGELTPEQEKQVGYIRMAAQDLSEIVDDLLDLAKVEAGKTVVRPVEFEVAGLFGALRGMLRPLLVNESVALVFEEADGVPPMYTDEGKVSQILRNFISNALKFTERGEVRVSAALDPGGAHVVFAVADTGIGIAPADQERIFQEFGQLENPVQRRVRGTGLGLPLTRRLIELLGGRLRLVSRPGAGSTFSAIVPVRFAQPGADVAAPPATAPAHGLPVLVVEDSVEDALVYEAFLRGSRFGMVRARTVKQAREAVRQARPAAVVLDIRLRGEDTWAFLAELKRDEATRDLPVLVVSTTDDPHKGLGLGADAYAVKPVSRDWLLDTLAAVTAPPLSVLVIDDDETARYLLNTRLSGPRFAVSEAADGPAGLRRARAERPDVIVLDLVMPGLSGADVLEALKRDEATRGIPVVVMTSKVLEAADHRRLAPAVAVLSKEASFDEVPAVLARAAGTARREGGGG
jgi:signal transduction histidine kinase/DNA-binding response OmpR family regulator